VDLKSEHLFQEFGPFANTSFEAGNGFGGIALDDRNNAYRLCPVEPKSSAYYHLS
jgi:hypothetical protein